MTSQEEKIIGISIGVVALAGGILFYFWYSNQTAVGIICTTQALPVCNQRANVEQHLAAIPPSSPSSKAIQIKNNQTIAAPLPIMHLDNSFQ